MQRLTIHEPSTGDTQILEGAALWATVLPGTLESDASLKGADPAAPRLVIRSQRVVSDAESAFAGWSNAGWQAFDAAVARTIDDTRTPVLIWPGSGSVLSDAVSTLSFARRQPGVGLLIDPVAWISPGMAKDAEDHLARFAQALLGCETIAAVIVRPCETASLGTPTVAKALSPLLAKVRVALALPSDHACF